MVSSGIGSSTTRSDADGAEAEEATAVGAVAVASGAIPVVVGAVPANVEAWTIGGPRPGGGREGVIPGGGAVLVAVDVVAGIDAGAEDNADEEVVSEIGFFLGEA